MPAALLELLAEARQRGLLGPGPIEPQVDHALGFLEAIRDLEGEAGPGLDLGSGGGLPGLVLAVAEPNREWTLLDSRERSIEFLRHAVRQLGVPDRVKVLLGRAEEVGRDANHRGAYSVVVARGFGPPAVTAECAAPLLEVGGRLMVSEPPTSTGERWPEGALAELGLRWKGLVSLAQVKLAVMEQVKPTPDRFPRRSGIPAKRPLFDPPTTGERFT